MLTRGRYGLIDSLAGPHDDIEIPEHAEMLDYEVDLHAQSNEIFLLLLLHIG